MDQFDDVADCAHDQEAHADCLADLDEFAAVRWRWGVMLAWGNVKGERRWVVDGASEWEGSYDRRDVRFVHLFRKAVPSLKKSLGMSARSWMASAILG